MSRGVIWRVSRRDFGSAGPYDDAFWQWNVTNGLRTFVVDNALDAEWLCEQLNVRDTRSAA